MEVSLDQRHRFMSEDFFGFQFFFFFLRTMEFSSVIKKHKLVLSHFGIFSYGQRKLPGNIENSLFPL